MVSDDADERLSANAGLESRRLKVKVGPLEAGRRVTANSATQLLKEGGIREPAQQKAITKPESVAERSPWLWPRRKEAVWAITRPHGVWSAGGECVPAVGDEVLEMCNLATMLWSVPFMTLQHHFTYLFISMQVIWELKSNFFLALSGNKLACLKEWN